MDIRILPLAALLAAAPLAALADPGETAPAMTADQFDARTRGKTITYTANGVPYGIEEYRPGHKVVWAFDGGECREGDWFQLGEQICFDYHDDTPLQCWTFHDSPAGLIARFEGDRIGAPLVSLQESATPLNCPGPEVGT